ncbi:acyl-CoA dehydratase activase [Anaerohalosphaeraceae bacterium U12dextr]
MITAGIDAGSRAIKMVLFDTERRAIVDQALCDQGVHQEIKAQTLYDTLLDKNRLKRSDISAAVATGYGRHLLRFCDTTVTEITCHAAGVAHWHRSAQSIIDIGGQDSKLIRLDSRSKVRDFVMNDRCAAGTGRFLEIVAQRLDIPLDQLGQVARQSTKPAQISSICVVFAETEIVGLLAAGETRENIVAGVQTSIVRRLIAMAAGDIAAPVVFTGGVALIPGMKEAFESALCRPVEISPHPQFTGALGAALLASTSKTI